VSSDHRASQCLADIVENVERIEGYVRGLDRERFARDGRTRDAVERCLERICEATRRLGDRARVLMPDQPCADIRGLGNRLRHAYDRVSAGVIWDTATHDLPGLQASAARALRQLQRGDAPDDSPSGVTHS
jgi:uncharacterized protein with HEPN domain